MKYVSTRGSAPVMGFEDVMLTGLAADGGLYVPQTWPTLSHEKIAGLAGLDYQAQALEVLRPYVDGDFSDAELSADIAGAYASFDHKAITPLVQLGSNEWLLELFHGPTLAFKDVAMQLLARLMDRALKRRGRRATIVGATSGDTGGAAVEAFRGRDAIDVFIMYPAGRVSDVQRRQMTTPPDANIHAIEVDGTFDDCQNILKALFNEHAFRDRYQLAGVNSINWARLAAQIVYYFTAGVALGAPHRKISFTVPTGNFGDVFAGYAAKRMGLPIERLVIATNVNDILERTYSTGRYEPRGVTATTSPSMDIQISSNFERLLFELSGRDAARVCDLMESLRAQGSFALSQHELEGFRSSFQAARASEAEITARMQRLARETGYVTEPHTAVGLSCADRVSRDAAIPMVTLATAHPAKFPDAVAAALGHESPAPQSVLRQRTLPERSSGLPNDAKAVADFIAGRARAGALPA
ncbi:MAG: threonine synthase [Hyphomicrobiaceae bacterium]